MLYKFLEEQRAEILADVEKKTVKLAGSLRSSEELRKGLPVFFGHLITFLRVPQDGSLSQGLTSGAAVHGKELLRLHYTLSHVVHAYGAMCQAITERAQTLKFDISTTDFHHLNLCLDVAIASAVSEFQFRSVQASNAREAQHLGSLVHELRNALSSATIAQQMIKQGLVGVGGSTARVLELALTNMRHLIDRSLSDVLLRADPELRVEQFPLNVLIDQIILTAQGEAAGKNQTLESEVVGVIEMDSDRQLLLSAIANLVQNALKYSRTHGRVLVKANEQGEQVIIEVRDECGGIAESAMKTIFRPFVSSGYDQSGMGLGLTIVRRAVKLLQGQVEAVSQAGQGCSFIITVPRILTTPSYGAAEEKVVQPRKG